MAKLDDSPQYTKLYNSKGFLEWFECKNSNATTNLLQWFDVFYPQNDRAHWTMEVANLWEKISWWAKFLKHWSNKKARLAPWMEEGAWNFLAQIGNYGVLWIPSTTNVLPLLDGNNKSGYGMMHKVWIKKLNRIPSMIELARKTPKTNEKRKTCKQRSMEVLACPCKHPSVIEFLTIHIETMEAYKLWWNERTFWKMLDYNTKCSPIMASRGVGYERPNMTCHLYMKSCEVGMGIHKPLSKDNIMLHFPPNKLNVVYIGVCDWGEAECF